MLRKRIIRFRQGTSLSSITIYSFADTTRRCRRQRRFAVKKPTRISVASSIQPVVTRCRDNSIGSNSIGSRPFCDLHSHDYTA
ncbi:zinc finger CCCH domain-containing protein [Trifolium repens]|nr:zinc finger CCCH domain-containing protein [Trifolium repens]